MKRLAAILLLAVTLLAGGCEVNEVYTDSDGCFTALGSCEPKP